MLTLVNKMTDEQGTFRDLAQVLKTHLADRVQENVSLASRVGYQVGGSAALLATCHNEAEVALCCKEATSRRVQVFCLGRGTNLLVRDGGIRGLVLLLEGELARAEQVETLPDGAQFLRVGGGMTTGALVQRLQKEALGGAEFLALIPGTMGGAVRMNAGAHGGEMRQILQKVRVVSADGRVEERLAMQLGLSYRNSNLKADEIVTSMVLRLEPTDAEESRRIIKEHAAYRQKTQPTNEPNAGSVFKNPQGDYAGRLLEAAGMKGKSVGGARVSEKHANFIVTRPGATASDVEELAGKMRKAVSEAFGVDLELEIKIVGDFE